MSGGRSVRRQGHDFERVVASELRSRYPDSRVARGLQSGGANQPDVYTVGTPLDAWWIECQWSRRPRPLAKLEQAERDAPIGRDPVCVWRKKGERALWATLRLETLLAVTGGTGKGEIERGSGLVVTCDLMSLLDLVDEARLAQKDRAHPPG